MLLGGKLHLKKHVLHLMFLQACKWAKQEEEDFFFFNSQWLQKMCNDSFFSNSIYRKSFWRKNYDDESLATRTCTRP